MEAWKIKKTTQRSGVRQIITNNVVIVLVFLLAWHAAALFEVRPFVSALYFACGVTFAVAVVLGYKYLPTVYLATVLAYYISFSYPPLHELHWIGPLRQTLIYGLAGLSIRHLWLSRSFRLTLPVAFRFLLTALAASLLSAGLAINIIPFVNLPQDVKADVFFSFWGGDFAGVMVTVPILLMLQHVLKRNRLSSQGVWGFLHFDRDKLKDALLLCAFAAALMLLAILLPIQLGSDARVDELALLAVLVAGLVRGVSVAFVVALLVSLLAIYVRPMLGLPVGLPIDVQLMIALGAAVALLAGASHDDKNHAWQKANFDSLTGLANHRCFVDRLEHEIQRSARNLKPFTLMYLDLDGFKAINDTHGHAAGDEVLRKTAERLRRLVRASDTVARLGGDEFAVILSETGDPAQAETLAQKMLEAILRPIPIAGDEKVSVSASVGLVYGGSNDSSAKQLMYFADMAMYQSKRDGKNRFTATQFI